LRKLGNNDVTKINHYVLNFSSVLLLPACLLLLLFGKNLSVTGSERENGIKFFSERQRVGKFSFSTQTSAAAAAVVEAATLSQHKKNSVAITNGFLIQFPVSCSASASQNAINYSIRPQSVRENSLTKCGESSLALAEFQ